MKKSYRLAALAFSALLLAGCSSGTSGTAVSYTHLTLPTIAIV